LLWYCRFFTKYRSSFNRIFSFIQIIIFSSVLMLQMRHYNKPVTETGKLEEVQDQVDELKDIMVKNIGKA